MRGLATPMGGGEKGPKRARAGLPPPPLQGPPLPQHLGLVMPHPGPCLWGPRSSLDGGPRSRRPASHARLGASGLLGGVVAEHPNLHVTCRLGRPGRSTTLGTCTTPRANSCPGAPHRTPGTCHPTCGRRCAGPPSSTSEWAVGRPRLPAAPAGHRDWAAVLGIGPTPSLTAAPSLGGWVAGALLPSHWEGGTRLRWTRPPGGTCPW